MKSLLLPSLQAATFQMFPSIKSYWACGSDHRAKGQVLLGAYSYLRPSPGSRNVWRPLTQQLNG